MLIALTLTMPVLSQGRLPHRSRFNHSSTEQYYGLRLGLNIASLSSDDAEWDTDSRAGIAFGAVYGLQLANATPLWLEAGLLYSEKGGKSVIQNETRKYRLSYLQVPLVIKYSLDIADDLYIDPFVGGFLAFGIAGKSKFYGTPAKDYKDRFSESSFDLYKRFDGGLRIGCGLEYQMLYAELGFDFGLANIGKDDFSSTRTQGFFVNVGVNF